MLAVTQDNELDRGATKIDPGVQRHCALTRQLMPVDDMIRFVVGPGHHVVPDVKRKLPGRGLWLTGTREAVAEAIKRNVFARGFKQDVRVAAELPATAEQMLERSALDALAIAGKAGRLVTGFAKVEAAIVQGDIAALIHASDAAEDGVRKLDAGLTALQRKMAEKPREIAIIDLFSGGQLDLALNRPNVVHAALLAGPGSETFLARVARLQRFRNMPAIALKTASADDARGQVAE
jgi:predicted RNA-binding protein YlxR (DUF448 family)